MRREAGRVSITWLTQRDRRPNAHVHISSENHEKRHEELSRAMVHFVDQYFYVINGALLIAWSIRFLIYSPSNHPSNQWKAPEAKSSCTCSTRNHKLILWPILWIAVHPTHVLATYQWIFSWNTIPTVKNTVGDKAFFLLLLYCATKLQCTTTTAVTQNKSADKKPI